MSKAAYQRKLQMWIGLLLATKRFIADGGGYICLTISQEAYSRDIPSHYATELREWIEDMMRSDIHTYLTDAVVDDELDTHGVVGWLRINGHLSFDDERDAMRDPIFTEYRVQWIEYMIQYLRDILDE